jgi:hypothetical protein
VRWIAALGGALLAVALFLPWYAYDTERTQREAIDVLRRGADVPTNEPIITVELTAEGSVASAWHVFTVVDLALAAIALLVIAAAFLPRLRLAAALAATAGVGLVAFRIVEHAGPDGFQGLSFYPSPTTGAWLALAGALVAAAAGWASSLRGS